MAVLKKEFTDRMAEIGGITKKDAKRGLELFIETLMDYMSKDEKVMIVGFGRFEMKGSQDDFYRALDNSMHMINTANGRDFDLPEYQKNLIYAKAIEIREDFTSWNNTSRNS